MIRLIRIHPRDDWPDFHWNEGLITKHLESIRLRQGKLIGRTEALAITLRTEAVLRTLTKSFLKASEIKGQNLDPYQVRSSLIRRLGIEIGALTPAERDVEDVVEMMLCNPELYQAAR